MSLLKLKKITALKRHILLFYSKQQIIYQLDCHMQQKVDFIQSPAQWLDWEEAPKNLSKLNLHQKEVMVPV